MSVTITFRRLALITTCLSLAAFAVADDRPLLLVLGMGVSICSWVMTRGPRPVTLPRLVLNLLVAASTLYLALALISARQDSVISALTDFLAMVLLIKMLDRGTMRDEAQMLTLSVFVVIGAILSGAQLALGLVLVFYTPSIIVAVMLWQLCWGIERRQVRAGLVGDTGSPPPATPRLRRQLAGMAVAAVGLSLLTGLGAFVLTPRSFIAGLTGQWGRPMPGAVSGYHDTIQLGKGGLISQSNTPVADVTLRGPDGKPTGPLDGPLYLRGVTLDTYNEAQGLWSTGESERDRDQEARRRDGRGAGASGAIMPRKMRAMANSWKGLSAAGALGAGRAPVVQEVALRNAPSEAAMFAVIHPTSVKAPEGWEVVYNPLDGTLKRVNGAPGAMSYLVESRADYAEASPEVLAEQALRGDASPFPQRLRLRALAEEILRGADVPLGAEAREPYHTRRGAMAILTYLRSFQYTLEMVTPREGQDPIDMFLFETRRGHCEYFAAGMAALCQSVGIPARIATGYASTEFNSISQRYVVRESDAHAWVEVATRPGRWETFDPTPPAGLELTARDNSGLFAWLRQLYDALEFSWAQNVISFDTARRSAITEWNPTLGDPAVLGRLRRAVRDVTAWLRGLLPEGAIGNVLGVSVAILVLAGLCLCAYLLARSVWRRLRRRAGPRAPDYTRPPPELARQLAFYPRMLEVLARGGLPKPDNRPPLSFADEVARRDAGAGGLVEQLTRRYYAIRFGGETAGAGAPDDALADLRTALARGPVR